MRWLHTVMENNFWSLLFLPCGFWVLNLDCQSWQQASVLAGSYLCPSIICFSVADRDSNDSLFISKQWYKFTHIYIFIYLVSVIVFQNFLLPSTGHRSRTENFNSVPHVLSSLWCPGNKRPPYYKPTLWVCSHNFFSTFKNLHAFST